MSDLSLEIMKRLLARLDEIEGRRLPPPPSVTDLTALAMLPAAALELAPVDLSTLAPISSELRVPLPVAEP